MVHWPDGLMEEISSTLCSSTSSSSSAAWMVFFPFPFPLALAPGDFCFGDFPCDLGDLCLARSAPSGGDAIASSGGILGKFNAGYHKTRRCKQNYRYFLHWHIQHHFKHVRVNRNIFNYQHQFKKLSWDEATFLKSASKLFSKIFLLDNIKIKHGEFTTIIWS